MSRWTHVAGIFRVDYFRVGDPDELEVLKKNIKEVLGPMVRWGDPSEVWEKGTKLPIGSEGSLEYDILVNPIENSVAVFTIPVWGDLRDFGDWGDVKKVEDWFNEACSKLWIRQAILQVEDEWEENSKTLVYKDPSS